MPKTSIHRIATILLNAFLALGLVAYWSWLFFQESIQTGQSEWRDYKGFVLWLVGLFVNFVLLLIFGWLNFRFTYLRWVKQQHKLAIYISWHIVLTWLAFEILQFKAEYESELLANNVLASLFLSVFLVIFNLVAESNYTRHQHNLLLKQKAEADLHALIAQINPHFLFNALNTIYSEALKSKQDKTALLVHQLSEILRFTLTQSGQSQITIEDETDYLQKFIDLHLARLHDRLRQNIKVEWEIENGQKKIAPLLLQPFIENALQYGIHTNNPFFIDISVCTTETKLTMEVSNSIHTNHLKKNSGTGQGIANVKKRLQLLYPMHSLEIREEENKYFVRLIVPFN